jgi:hypothetical protein
VHTTTPSGGTGLGARVIIGTQPTSDAHRSATEPPEHLRGQTMPDPPYVERSMTVGQI